MTWLGECQKSRTNSLLVADIISCFSGKGSLHHLLNCPLLHSSWTGLLGAWGGAGYPLGIKSAVQDSRDLTKRPLRAVVEMLLTLSRQARQILPEVPL